MTLKDWLEREAVKVPEFAARIGRTAEAVRRYVAGERIPDKDTMPIIVEATSGAVMPNDFFGLTVVSAVPISLPPAGKIERATDGRVRSEDLILTPTEQAAA